MTSVTRSLQKVDGAKKADVSLEKKEAVVTYDDTKTTVETLTQATTKAGFPSKQK